jgi:hypothetical protein
VPKFENPTKNLRCNDFLLSSASSNLAPAHLPTIKQSRPVLTMLRKFLVGWQGAEQGEKLPTIGDTSLTSNG